MKARHLVLLGFGVALSASPALVSPAPVSAAAGTKASQARTKASPARSARHAVLPFIEDDYARALAQARAKKIPIFIDAWAPW